MTSRDPEGLPEGGGTGRAAAGLIEGLVRDWTTNGAVLLSLVVIAAGFIDGTSPWPAVGLVVGAVGAVLAFVTIARKWPPARTWLVVLTILAVDAAVLAAIWMG